ncbi:hypothetical protein [Microvirga makkahensis]|uniref:hypothetical protein n=1 Tax=Microvirga makkahensis TaxID=1128670 RepID=UPI0014782923|nr:hypothetical protein [Microvirga makkahensis]
MATIDPVGAADGCPDRMDQDRVMACDLGQKFGRLRIGADAMPGAAAARTSASAGFVVRPSEDQRQDADHNREADQEDDADGSSEYFEHVVSFRCLSGGK